MGASLSLRAIIGLALDERTPDHPTLNGTGRRLPLAVHQAVFAKALAIQAQAALLRGETLGVNAPMVAAYANLKQLRTRLDGTSYTAYVRELMSQAPAALDESTAAEVTRYDRRRRGKKLPNEDWHTPHNPEARPGRMKDGWTRFCGKVEQAVELTTRAVVGVTVSPQNRLLQRGNRGQQLYTSSASEYFPQQNRTHCQTAHHPTSSHSPAELPRTQGQEHGQRAAIDNGAQKPFGRVGRFSDTKSPSP